MNRKLLSLMFSLMIFFILSVPVFAQAVLPITEKQYHDQIAKLWKQKKARYEVLIRKSGENSRILYELQVETNNLLTYAGYCQKYELIDELSGLYLRALDTLTTTDNYIFAYYPGSPKNSAHKLNKKYRMWSNKNNLVGNEIILDSSQFLYLLSDTVNIISAVKKEKRTPNMQEALKKFIPLLIEHYDRWIFDTPGPFQVRDWGCRYNGQNVSDSMNHYEFLNKKLENKLGNGKSPEYCNMVRDMDMWIIAGVANILVVYKKEKDLVPITPEKYKALLNYEKMGVELVKRRFAYTKLRNFNGQIVTGAVFQPGIADEHRDFAYAGYTGQEYPRSLLKDKSNYRGKGVGWDLAHARRFVHVFDTLLKSKDVLGLNFPTVDFMGKMANQLVYGTFNRDFKKPLFTNYMDGTNGWYRVDYSGRTGFGYGPWDMSIEVLTGGYGFWSIYSSDTQKVFLALMDMLKSNDPEIKKHVADHYETNFWNQYKRTRDFDFAKADDPKTQGVLIQFLPSLCFMYK